MPAVTTRASCLVCLLAGLLSQPVAASVVLTSSGRLESSVSGTGSFDTGGIAIDPLAPDFFPDRGQQISFGTQTQIHYNSIRIDPGIAISLKAPAGTALTLVSNQDIVIGGDLNWLGGPLSLISLAGELTLQGAITAASISLGAGTIQLTDGGGLRASDVTLLSNGNITLQPVPLPGAFWLLASGLISAGVVCRRPQRISSPATSF